MCDLRRIFRESPDIGDRTENEINDEVDEEIEKMFADVGHLGISAGDESLPGTQPVKYEWCDAVEQSIQECGEKPLHECSDQTLRCEKVRNAGEDTFEIFRLKETAQGTYWRSPQK